MAQSQLGEARIPSLRSQSRISRTALSDGLFRGLVTLCASLALLLILCIGIALLHGSAENIIKSGLRFVTGERWVPNPPTATMHVGNLFGMLPFVYGTVVTSAIALLLAVPIGVGAAVFLAEIAPRRLSAPLSFLVEMLAAVPSIVYGYWGLIYLVPLLGNVQQWFTSNFGDIPLFAAGSGSGAGFFAAGLVLTLMILPFITAVSRDVLLTVPKSQRDASLSFGATRWETISKVVLKHAGSGIIGAVMLGLARALGETMAVTMVVGNNTYIPHLKDLGSFSLFQSGYTMTSLLMDQYPSPNSALHASAMTEIALALFFITVVVNAIARGLVWLTANTKSGGSVKADSIKKGIGLTAAVLLTGGLGILFLVQIASDLHRRGAAGLFGGAELIALLIVAGTSANLLLPGTRYYLMWRKMLNALALAACMLSTAFASLALVGLLLYVMQQGVPGLNAAFFKMPNPANPNSFGMLNAVLGTVELVGMAALIGLPAGVLGGVYLAEFGDGRLGFLFRFFTDLLNGVPSIVLGIFSYAVIVVTTRSNAGYAGGFALAVMMIPVVMRTTEELMRLVPQSLRDASLGLGATHARTVWKVVLPAARSGIITGALLAISRVAGETAPLIMVGCANTVPQFNPHEPLASLPVGIYTLRNYPDALHIQQSWTSALTLVLLVLAASLMARLLTRRKFATD